MQVGIADPPGAVTDALGGAVLVSSAAVRAPTAARGDAAQLLDVYVDHRSGSVMLESQDGAHLLAGGRVEVAHAADPATHQDSVHGGRGEHDAVVALHLGRDPRGSVLRGPSQLFHQILGGRIGPGRRAFRC